MQCSSSLSCLCFCVFGFLLGVQATWSLLWVPWRVTGRAVVSQHHGRWQRTRWCWMRWPWGTWCRTARLSKHSSSSSRGCCTRWAVHREQSSPINWGVRLDGLAFSLALLGCWRFIYALDYEVPGREYMFWLLFQVVLFLSCQHFTDYKKHTKYHFFLYLFNIKF